MRRHRRDDDGLWSEQSQPSTTERVHRTSPTLEPAEDRPARVIEDEDWRLAAVAFLVWWLPEWATGTLCKAIALLLGCALALGFPA